MFRNFRKKDWLLLFLIGGIFFILLLYILEKKKYIKGDNGTQIVQFIIAIPDTILKLSGAGASVGNKYLKEKEIYAEEIKKNRNEEMKKLNSKEGRAKIAREVIYDLTRDEETKTNKRVYKEYNILRTNIYTDSSFEEDQNNYFDKKVNFSSNSIISNNSPKNNNSKNYKPKQSNNNNSPKNNNTKNNKPKQANDNNSPKNNKKYIPKKECIPCIENHEGHVHGEEETLQEQLNHLTDRLNLY